MKNVYMKLTETMSKHIDKLGNLFVKISKDIQKKDYEILKFLCDDGKFLSKSKIEECDNSNDSATALFKALQECDIITKDDVGWLRDILPLMDKTYLLSTVDEYVYNNRQHRLISSFKELLLGIAKEITDRELEQLKHLVKDLQRSISDGIGTTFELFSTLEQRAIISSDDVSWLKTTLVTIEKKSLLRLIEEYEEKYGKKYQQERRPNDHMQPRQNVAEQIQIRPTRSLSTVEQQQFNQAQLNSNALSSHSGQRLPGPTQPIRSHAQPTARETISPAQPRPTIHHTTVLQNHKSAQSSQQKLVPSIKHAEQQGQGVQPSMGQGVQPSMGQGVQPSMGQGVQPSMGQGVQPSMGQGVQPSMGQGVQPSMGPGVKPSTGQAVQPSQVQESVGFHRNVRPPPGFHTAVQRAGDGEVPISNLEHPTGHEVDQASSSPESASGSPPRPTHLDPLHGHVTSSRPSSTTGTPTSSVTKQMSSAALCMSEKSVVQHIRPEPEHHQVAPRMSKSHPEIPNQSAQQVQETVQAQNLPNFSLIGHPSSSTASFNSFESIDQNISTPHERSPLIAKVQPLQSSFSEGSASVTGQLTEETHPKLLHHTSRGENLATENRNMSTVNLQNPHVPDEEESMDPKILLQQEEITPASLPTNQPSTRDDINLEKETNVKVFEEAIRDNQEKLEKAKLTPEQQLALARQQHARRYEESQGEAQSVRQSSAIASSKENLSQSNRGSQNSAKPVPQSLDKGLGMDASSSLSLGNMGKQLEDERRARAKNMQTADQRNNTNNTMSIPLSLRGPESTYTEASMLADSRLHTDAPQSSDRTMASAVAPNLDVRPKTSIHRGPAQGSKSDSDQSKSYYDKLSTGQKLPENRTRSRLLVDGDMEIPGDVGDRQKEERLRRLDLQKKKLSEQNRWQQEDIHLYGYQHELAAPALEGLNCILCAPTGSGKTFTAGHVCFTKWQQALNAHQKFKALFIVCIRNLVNQQKEALKQICPSGHTNIIEGMADNCTLSEMCEKYDVVVLTAQILVNSLKHNDVSLHDYQLLILDECHHTDLGHPYNVIMRQYHELKKGDGRLPQIMGLTASLGVGDKADDPVDHYIRMCANLDCTYITHVRDEAHMAELLQHNPRPERNQIIAVQPRDPNDMFILTIEHMMQQVEKLTSHLPTLQHKRGTQKYENWMVQLRTAAEEHDKEDEIFTCETLLVMNNTLLYYDELQAREVLPLLQQHFNERDRAEVPTPKRYQVYELYDEQAQELSDVATLEKIDENAKLEKLTNLLYDLYYSKPQSKGILLARTRFAVEGLVRFIKQQDNLKKVHLQCGKFVGQGRGDGTMTDTEQDLMLQMFKSEPGNDPHINLLVATDVAQEGLDMPLCNFVIRYNFVSNEIGSVQSRGRARARNSECYLIVNRGSINERREYENLEKEHAMLEALNDIDTLDEDELKNRIRERQDQLAVEHENREQRKALASHLYDAATITIHCKGCKQLLCAAIDMRKRGSNFIVCDEEFLNRIDIKKRDREMKFRYDTQIGYTFCKDKKCNRQLGPEIQYQQGKRKYGYALSKEAAMWKVYNQTEYRNIKQWSKVPFAIEEESINE